MLIQTASKKHLQKTMLIIPTAFKETGTLNKLKTMVKILLAIVFQLKRMIVKIVQIIEIKETISLTTTQSMIRENNIQKTIERRRKKISKACNNKISS